MNRLEHFNVGSGRDPLTTHPNLDVRNSGGIGHLEGSGSRSVTGMVPIHQLMPYVEHDGNQNPQAVGRDRRIIDGIKDDLTSGKGLREPLMLEYDHKMKWGSLGEGNHRLAALQETGHTHAPVTVFGRSSMGRRKEDGLGAPLSMRTKFTGGMGEDYVPPNVHPAHFGLG